MLVDTCTARTPALAVGARKCRRVQVGAQSKRAFTSILVLRLRFTSLRTEGYISPCKIAFETGQSYSSRVSQLRKKSVAGWMSSIFLIRRIT